LDEDGGDTFDGDEIGGLMLMSVSLISCPGASKRA